VCGGGESRHVDANLGHDDFSRSTSNARDGLKPFEMGFQRAGEFENPRVALRDQGRGVVELR
jgi:hypothetical protein